jgi:MraZ protein
MTEFLGEYEVSVDNRGRLLLPAGIRKQIPEGFGEKFVVNRGFEKCVTIYTMDVWNVIHQKVNKLNSFKEDVRLFKRLFLNGACYADIDNADRILIPKQLMEHAGIVKEAVLTAQGDKLELWDKDTYYKHINENAGSYSSLANNMGNLFDGE